MESAYDLFISWASAVLAGITLLGLGVIPIKSYLQKRARIPRNFLTQCELMVSAEWIKKKYGEPRYKVGDQWVYHFTDAFATLTFHANMTVRSVIVALKDWNCRVDIPVLVHDIPPLGEATLAEVATSAWSHGPVYEIRNEGWGRGSGAAIRLGDGVTGAYRWFGFGALWPLTPGCLVETEFCFEDNQKIVRNIEGVRINWAGMAATPEELELDWGIGLLTQNTGE